MWLPDYIVMRQRLTQEYHTQPNGYSYVEEIDIFKYECIQIP